MHQNKACTTYAYMQISGAAQQMTLNGVRLPCPCSKCRGAEKGWRTVDAHLAREKADRPVYQPPAPVLARVRPAVIAQVPVDPVNQIDAPLQNGDPPHSPDDQEDTEFVSHIENLPNWNDPAYESVHDKSHTQITQTFTYYGI
jgi:hypothetical protein